MKHNSEMQLVVGWLLALSATVRSLSAVIMPVPDKVVCAVADRQALTEPDQVHLAGSLGARIEANETNRLAKVDVNPLLAGFRSRPSAQTYDGEHVGMWLHAASVAWVNTGDPALRQTLDYTAAELIKYQEADGYLGTYLARNRWTAWDVSLEENAVNLAPPKRSLWRPISCRQFADIENVEMRACI
jgi:hypothetical protein